VNLPYRIETSDGGFITYHGQPSATVSIMVASVFLKPVRGVVPWVVALIAIAMLLMATKLIPLSCFNAVIAFAIFVILVLAALAAFGSRCRCYVPFA